MTYNYNKEQHTAKIKAGLETAKKNGKKLGRPKGGKIKGEDSVLETLSRGRNRKFQDTGEPYYLTNWDIAEVVGISKSTVQKIINKYKGK
jgi:DNA invertase Pin-like site-specific DNA recombinase